MLFLGNIRSQLQHLSIGHKVSLAVAVLAAAAILISALALTSLESLNNRLNTVVDVSAEKVKLAARIKQDLLAITRAEKNIILATTPTAMDAHAAFIDNTREAMQIRREQLRTLVDEAGKQLLDTFAEKWDQWLAVNTQVRKLTRLNSNVRARALSAGEGRAAFDRLEKSLSQLATKNEEEFDQAQEQGKAQALAVSGRRLKLSARLLRNVVEYQRAEKNLILATSDQDMDVYAAAIAALDEEIVARFATLRQLVTTESWPLLDAADTAFRDYRPLNRQVQAFSRENGNVRAFALAAAQGRQLADACEELLTAIVDKNDEQMTQDRIASDENAASTWRLVLLLSSLGLFGSTGVAVVVVRNITQNIAGLTAYAQTVETTRDLSTPVPITARDEIGQLERSFDAMRRVLEESQERLHRLARVVTDSNVAVVVRTLSGTITAWNRGAERMYGYTEAEALQMTIENLLPEDLPQERRAETEAFAQAIVEGGTIAPFETQRQTKEGRYLEVWVTVTVLTDPAGQPVAIATTEFDITERKRFEQRLEELIQERTAELQAAQAQLVKQERLATLGQLAGSVAHEIRNPLGIIKNATYFLKATQTTQTAEVDTDTQDAFEEIERGLENADRIIRELLDYGRDPTTQHIMFALEDVIDQALKDADIPPAVHIEWQKHEPDGSHGPSHHVQGDPGQIEQLLGNLLRNAVQAMPAGGTLTVRCVAKNGQACIEVSDTGGGIGPQDVQKIFEPLYTTKTKGIGLGLAVARRYAELHHGRLDVESKLGQGSTFRVTLPLATAQIV